MRRTYLYSILFLFFLAIITLIYFCWSAPVTTVILVRHAEKVEVPPSPDPPLTPEGMQRAETLAHVVEDTGIDVIFATEFQRTQATVAPAAANLSLTPVIISAGNTDEQVNLIKSDHKGDEVLVAGHSDTVPMIIEGLGISSPPSIGNEYDNLFVVHIRHLILIEHAKLTHLKYGEPITLKQ